MCIPMIPVQLLFWEKGKVLLKFTSRKTLALRDVLHSIRVNIIFVALLGKVGVKM